MGSSLAQNHIGELLSPHNMQPDIARKFLQCAASQGNGNAALSLAVDYKIDGEFDEALKLFQLGIAAGNSTSSSFMYKAFNNPSKDNKLHYLGQLPDPKRVERYQQIWSLLADWSYADPKVPEINEIVPLPPAVLSPWDGKLQWVEERLANIPPPEPREYELRELAKASFLEPDTGKPTPDHPGFERKDIPDLVTGSGNPCPKTGYWSATLYHEYHREDPFEHEHVTRRFIEGTVLPTLVETQLHRRMWPWRDEVVKQVVNVGWKYIG